MLTVSLETRPGSDRPNEDWCGATADTVVVLDGVTAPRVAKQTCHHSVPWFVSHLGAHLLRCLPGMDLGEGLAAAIQATNRHHKVLCDLTGPGVPAAAVGILRVSDGWLEYLILADVTLVLDTANGLHVVTDHRVDQAAPVELAATRKELIGTPEHTDAVARMSVQQLQSRNVPGGYWVASADPSAAIHALRGKVLASEVRRAALMTDGASRIVDVFGALDWPACLRLLDEHGPAGLIRRVRQLEDADPDGACWPRFKKGDDATAAFVTIRP